MKALLGFIGTITLSALASAATVSQVSTASGIYQGHDSEYARGVTVFKGIAYAAPPVRDLRWKAPAPPIPFAGVHPADKIGPACWQSRNSDDTLYARGNLERSEDCLYLNIFSAARDSSDALPVMVWFHGGGNTAGHGGPLIFDGSHLAARGAVIVTANYRLGALGFLAHPALTAESPQHVSGNYGLLDQVAVLEWVQANIAGFGGDPGRVTIFGQSAGGTDVCLLMASPRTEGLIDGVIGESSGCIMSDTRLDSGQERGLAYAVELGVSGSDRAALEQLRAVPAEMLVETGAGGGPVIDGWLIPDRPYDLLQSGRHNNIPVMVGGLANENHGLQHTAPPITEQQLDQFLTSSFGSTASLVKAAYAEELKVSPLDARKQITTENSFILSARLWGKLVQSRGNNAYVYYFTRVPPVFRLYVPEAPDLYNDGGQRRFGAYHSGELAYVFDNLDLVGVGWNDDDRKLAELMADYWVSFAKDGNPNGDGLPNWPAYDGASDVVQILDTDTHAAVHPQKSRLDIFERLFLQSRQGSGN